MARSAERSLVPDGGLGLVDWHPYYNWDRHDRSVDDLGVDLIPVSLSGGMSSTINFTRIQLLGIVYLHTNKGHQVPQIALFFQDLSLLCGSE